MSVTLKGIAWDHPRGYDSVAGASALWAQGRPGVRVEWSRRSLQAFGDARLGDLAEAYDLLVMDHPHIPEAARAGWLWALDGRGHDQDLDRLAEESLGASHASYAYEGHQYALAIDAAAQVVAYRPDLLAGPPDTWEAVWALAAGGRMLWPLKAIDAFSSFCTLAASRGSACGIGPSGFVAPAAGRAVLEDLHRGAAAVPEECMAMDPIAVAERLATSDRWWFAPLAFGYVNYSRAGFRGRRVAYANAPAGPGGVRGACLGGAGIAVSAHTGAPAEAVDLAFFLASADVQRGVYFASGGQPANGLAWRDDDLDAQALSFFGRTRETLERAWVRPRHPRWMDFQDLASQLVHRALKGEIADEACIEAMNGACRELLGG